MVTNAISRPAGGNVAFARLDDYGLNGEFNLDGSVIRGTLGTLSQSELAYMIWRQGCDVRWSEARCRKEYAAR